MIYEYVKQIHATIEEFQKRNPWFKWVTLYNMVTTPVIVFWFIMDGKFIDWVNLILYIFAFICYYPFYWKWIRE